MTSPSEPERERCPECESADTIEGAATETIELFGGSVSFSFPWWSCRNCSLEWRDYRHEDAELRARHDFLVLKVTELQREVDSLRSFKRSVNEALNSGDGSYRP